VGGYWEVCVRAGWAACAVAWHGPASLAGWPIASLAGWPIQLPPSAAFCCQACSILYKTRLPVLLVFNKVRDRHCAAQRAGARLLGWTSACMPASSSCRRRQTVAIPAAMQRCLKKDRPPKLQVDVARHEFALDWMADFENFHKVTAVLC